MYQKINYNKWKNFLFINCILLLGCAKNIPCCLINVNSIEANSFNPLESKFFKNCDLDYSNKQVFYDDSGKMKSVIYNYYYKKDTFIVLNTFYPSSRLKECVVIGSQGRIGYDYTYYENGQLEIKRSHLSKRGHRLPNNDDLYINGIFLIEDSFNKCMVERWNLQYEFYSNGLAKTDIIEVNKSNFKILEYDSTGVLIKEVPINYGEIDKNQALDVLGINKCYYMKDYILNSLVDKFEEDSSIYCWYINGNVITYNMGEVKSIVNYKYGIPR